MTNEQTHILIETIIIMAEDSTTKEQFIEKLKRLQQIKKPQQPD